jgi:hypothetical protein
MGSAICTVKEKPTKCKFALGICSTMANALTSQNTPAACSGYLIAIDLFEDANHMEKIVQKKDLQSEKAIILWL